MEKIVIDNETTSLIAGANAALELRPIGVVTNKYEAIDLKNYSELSFKLSKQLKTRCTEITKPLTDNIANINNQIMPIVRQLDELSKAANRAVHIWQAAEMQRAADERREQLLSQTPATVPATLEPQKLTKTRSVTKIEIVGDIKDVDPDYTTLILNDDKIEAAIKAGRLPINGLKIYQVEEPVRG